MKYALLALAIFATSAFASVSLPGRSQCKITIAAAKHTVKYVEARFHGGEATRIDVNRAKLDLLDLRLGCYEIVRGTAKRRNSYCAAANVQTMDEYVRGISDEARVGNRTQQELQQANSEKALREANCAP